MQGKGGTPAAVKPHANLILRRLGRGLNEWSSPLKQSGIQSIMPDCTLERYFLIKYFALPDKYDTQSPLKRVFILLLFLFSSAYRNSHHGAVRSQRGVPPN